MLHLLELDASGARVNEVNAPVSASSTCPSITVDPTGNYLSFSGGLGTATETAVSVFRFANNALSAIATLPAAPEGTIYRWQSGGDNPLVEVRDQANGSASFAWLKEGALTQLAGSPFIGQHVPSADGRIFLSSVETLEPNSATRSTKFSILEVGCDAAQTHR